MSKSGKSLVAAGVAGATALALWVLPVGAQSEDTSDSTDGSGGTRVEQFEERRAEFHEALAEELGVSVEKLEAAFEKVKNALFEEHLQELVDEGTITEEQATTMREHHEFHQENGMMGPGAMGGMGGPGGHDGHHGPGGPGGMGGMGFGRHMG